MKANSISEVTDCVPFFEMERNCEYMYNQSGPFWHLTTPGENQEILFTCDDEYKAGINFLAYFAAVFQVRILAFAIMSNHIHVVIASDYETCVSFFDAYRRKLKTYLNRRKRYVVMDNFKMKDGPIAVESLQQLRNTIAYVNRNAFVINTNVTPYSTKWDTGSLFFCDMAFQLDGITFVSSHSIMKQRELLHGRFFKLPDHYTVRNDMIQPSSFCAIREGESYFRNAHNYISCLMKNQEAFSEIAKAIGDKVILADEEMYHVVNTICVGNFNKSTPKMLEANERIEVARIMKSKYNATNKQIKRILKLDDSILNELFPKAK